MGILARLSIVLGVALAALALAGVGYQTLGAARDAARFPAPGRIVEIDGRDVHVQCSGAGSPGVALEAGAGLWSTHWRGVQPAVAKYTRVCSYDRPGLGWSEPVDEPRSRTRMADQLRSTLRAVAGEPPWVLVGHSLGGLTALHLAAAHPDEIAGLVLVDSAHPGWDLRVSMETLEATNALLVIDGNLIDSNLQAGIGLMDGGVTKEDFRAASLLERIHVFRNTFAGNDHGISGGDNMVVVNNIFINHVNVAVKQVDGGSSLLYNLFWNNGVDNAGSNVDPPTTLFDDPQLPAVRRVRKLHYDS